MNNPNEAYPKKGRVILHIDMNAFYCSVHAAVDPERYKGKPTAVAGSVELRRGIVVTSSYEARKRGVKTAMLVSQALKCCPDLLLIRPDFDLYREFSRKFMQIAYSYSPLIEAMSIDECYLDITGSKQFGTPLQIAEKLQMQIKRQLELPCSIGIAPNKLLAKMGSDMKKPNGITILRLRDVPAIFWDKPCSYLYGIGSQTAKKLSKFDIHTLGQLAHADEQLLKKHFGVMGGALKRAANGIDHSLVNPEKAQSKSIGHTTTLPRDYSKLADIQRVFLNLSDQVTRRLRRQGLIAEVIQIVIRNPEMKTITRSCTLSIPTENMDTVYHEACRLYQAHWNDGEPVRLLGVTLQGLRAKEQSAIQLDLFDFNKQPKQEKLNKIMDSIRDKYGEDAILTAAMLDENPATLIRNHKARGTSLQMDHLREKSLDQED